MKNHSIRESVWKIYERIHGHPPDRVISTALEQIIEENGLKEHCAVWLEELLQAVAYDEDYESHSLSFDEFFDSSYDVINFSADLSEIIGIRRTNEGEYLLLSFDSIGTSILFDFETRSGDIKISCVRSS